MASCLTNNFSILKSTDIDAVLKSHEKDFIPNLAFNDQRDVVKHIANDLYRSALVDSERTIKDVKEDLLSLVNTKLMEYNSSLEATQTLVNLGDADAIIDRAEIQQQLERFEAIVDNIEKLNFLAVQSLRTIQGLNFVNLDAPIIREAVNDNTEATEAGLERTSFSDTFSIELDSKNTTSARLKEFLSFIPNYIIKEENIEKETTFFGATSYLEFDEVYNELHRLLEGIPAKSSSILAKLDAEVDIGNSSLLWLKEFLNQLKASPTHIQKEFISDMSKHKIEMKFVLYDTWVTPEGIRKYSLKVMSDNSSSTSARLLRVWNKEHKNSSLVVEGNYKEGAQEGLLTQLNQIRKFSLEEDPGVAVAAGVQDLLATMGILVNQEFIDSIFVNGAKLYIDKSPIAWSSIIAQGGPLERLVKNVKDGTPVSESGINTDTITKAFALGSAKFEQDIFSNSFRVGDKTIYTYSNNQYFVNRVRDLREDETLRRKLQKTLFSKESFYLDLLQGDSGFNDWFQHGYVSLNPLKRMKGKRSDSLAATGEVDHEVTKLGYFHHGKSHNKVTYKGQQFTGRKAVYFAPTNADKSKIMSVQGISVESTETRVNNGKATIAYSPKALDLFIDSVLQAEMNRIYASSTEGFEKAADLATYNGGLFYLLPELNELQIDGKLFLDTIKASPNLTPETREVLRSEVQKILKDKAKRKRDVWKDLGILEPTVIDKEGKKVTRYSFAYIDAATNSRGQKASIMETSMDYVFNYMMLNANMFQLVVGDIAQYYKSDSTNHVQQAIDTYDNVSKRLAAEIAPGIEFDSEDIDYIQIFAKDIISESVNMAYYKKLLSKEEAKEYAKIKGTDAQEYTTWKEHLNILRDLGRITAEEYKEAFTAFANDKEPSKATFKKVLQPLKPVFVDNIIEEVGEYSIDKKYYIKSSSFPLIPTLTKGLELDEVRLAMEALSNSKEGKGRGVRLAYKTATKVGFPKTSSEIVSTKNVFKKDLKFPKESYKFLNRKGFRIQQDIPYDATAETINKGSQEAKLLWTNTQGKYAKEYRRYIDLYQKLYVKGKNELMNRLFSDNNNLSLEELSDILKQELITRGETSQPLLDGLDIVTTSTVVDGRTVKVKNFSVPLWLSPYADKYTALLNSIVKKSIISHKLYGKSFVLGSAEGFTGKPELIEGEEGQKYIDNNNIGILFTDSYNPELGLQGVREDPKTGEILPAQILIPFKFRDDRGNLLDLEDFTTTVNKRKVLDYKKLPKDLLKSFGFRIPTQLHASMSYMEVVGFLPRLNGDLIIAPKEFVSQMGSDFDVDKLYTYLYKTAYDKETGFSKIKIDPEHEIKLREVKKALREVKLAIPKTVDIRVLTTNIRSEVENTFAGDKVAAKKVYSQLAIPENIDNKIIIKYIELLQAKETLKRNYEAGIKNELLDIHLNLLSQKDTLLQQSIASPLGFGDYLNDIEGDGGFANKIDKLQTKTNIPSIIDDEYQKEKFFDGTAGKDGISVFSSDSVFNALAQGKDIKLLELFTDSESGKTFPILVSVMFGNKYENSTGDLSDIHTLKKNTKRLKTEVIAAAQNLSVDNANEQGMYKVNMNSETFGVYSLLNFLGFEEDISAPFMSQPIIREYARAMRNNRTILKPYEAGFEDNLINTLIEKYSKEAYNSEIHSKLADFAGKDASNTMMNLIEQKEAYPEFGLYQAAILEKFSKLKSHERTISKVKKLLNLDSKGFSKSMYMNKKAWSTALDLDTGLLKNADKLLGQVLAEEDPETGFMSKFIIPDTLAGFDNVYGRQTLVESFGEMFLDSNSELNFEAVVEQIESLISPGKELHENEIYKIQEEYKTFLMSKFRPLIDTEGKPNVDAIRKRLFFKKDEGSFFKNLNTLKATGYGSKNTFLKSLEVIWDKKVEVNYNNAAGDNFDESAMYFFFIDMFKHTEEINGIVPAKLAEDLVLYGLLRGGNKSDQFLKFIPTQILNKILDTSTVVGADSLFLEQWLRHNSNKLLTLNPTASRKNLKNDSYFRINEKQILVSAAAPKYVQVDEGLYTKVDKTNIYHRINTLGIDGFTEYKTDIKRKSLFVKNNIVDETNIWKLNMPFSILNNVTAGTQVITQKTSSDESKVIVDDMFRKLDFTSTRNLLTSITDLKGQQFNFHSELAKELLNVVDESLKIQFVDGFSNYNSITNTISINKDLNLKKDVDVLSTILHEYLHAVTVPVIDDISNGFPVPQALRSAVVRLNGFKNQLIDKLSPQQKLEFKVVLVEYLKKKTFTGGEPNLKKINSLKNDQLNHNFIKEVVTEIELFAKGEVIDPAENLPAFQDISREDVTFYYSMMNLNEFLAVAGSQPELVQKYEELSGGTYIEKIKSFFRELMNILGIKNSPAMEAMLADIFTIAQFRSIDTKAPVENIGKEEEAVTMNMLVEFNNYQYYMDKDSIYRIGNETDKEFVNEGQNRTNFINNYVAKLLSQENKMIITQDEFNDNTFRPFEYNNVRFVTVTQAMQYHETTDKKQRKTFRELSYKANPGIAAKFIQEEQHPTIVTNLLEYFGISELTIEKKQIIKPVTTSDTKEYSREKLPTIPVDPVVLVATDKKASLKDQSKAKYVTKMIGFGTENSNTEAYKDAFNNPFKDTDDLLELETSGEDIVEKCKGSTTPKAEKGLLVTKPKKKRAEAEIVKNSNTSKITLGHKWQQLNSTNELYAEKGVVIPRSNKDNGFVGGSPWSLVKDLKGKPSHKRGGVKLHITENSVTFAKGKSKVIAKNGLLIKKE